MSTPSPFKGFSVHYSRRESIVFILVLYLLAACTLPISEPDTPKNLPREQALKRWQINQKVLGSINHWNLKGKIGVKTGSKGGSATIKWQYAPGSQEIELYGPLGSGRIIITVNSEGAVLRDTKGRVLRGTSASNVLYQRLGWQVPFDHLANWARGVPGEGAQNIVIDTTGRLQGMVQDQWQVEYQQYETVGTTLPGYSLPLKLQVSAVPGTMEFFSDDGQPLGDQLNVRIILKRWEDIERQPS